MGVIGAERAARKLSRMLNSSQCTRSAVIAATVICLGATPAIARQADVPPRPKAAVTAVAHATRQWTQPRVDGTGVRAESADAAVPSVQAASLPRASHGSAGREWLLIPLGALALAFLLILLGVRTDWHWAHPFGARHARAR